MNILAVDTAGKTVGVALLPDDRLLYECYLDAGMTHSETIMPTASMPAPAALPACASGWRR